MKLIKYIMKNCTWLNSCGSDTCSNDVKKKNLCSVSDMFGITLLSWWVYTAVLSYCRRWLLFKENSSIRGWKYYASDMGCRRTISCRKYVGQICVWGWCKQTAVIYFIYCIRVLFWRHAQIFLNLKELWCNTQAKHLNLQEKLWCKLKIWDFYLASENLMTEFKIEHVFQCVLEICESTVASFSYYICFEYFKSISDSLEVCCFMVYEWWR